MSVTERYAQYCTSIRYDDIPEEVIEYAKHLVLDTVGITIGSYEYAESSDTFLDAARTMSQNGTGATVLATGEQLTPEQAALANGSLAHSLDYDDTHREASLHPGAPVISTALAAGERVNASGEELLTGIVAGYDIICRMGMAINPASHYNRGFHMTGTCGLFGATATAGVILGLGTSELEAAFGINGSQAAGSLQFLENGGWNKRFHPGHAAHSALVSVTLAQSGFFAASKPIEGEQGFLNGYSDDPHPDKAIQGLGEEFELLNTGIKPYPCCRYMHTPLDILFEISGSEEIDCNEIDSVTIALPGAGINLVGRPTNPYPKSFVDGQFNMAFGAALALCRTEATVDAFLENVGDVDDDLKRIIDNTTVTTANWIEEIFPEKWGAEVQIEVEGKTHTGTGEYPNGDPESPLSWNEIVEKYDELTEPVIGEDTATEVRHRVSNLETISVTELLEPLAEIDRTVSSHPTD